MGDDRRRQTNNRSLEPGLAERRYRHRKEHWMERTSVTENHNVAKCRWKLEGVSGAPLFPLHVEPNVEPWLWRWTDAGQRNHCKVKILAPGPVS